MLTGDPQQLVTELLIILVAISVGSFVKGATGSGLPLIVIPVMSVFLGIERSVVIMAIPGIVTNGWLIWAFRSHLRATRDLPVLVGVGIAGAIVGTIALDVLDPAILALAMAVSIWTYIAIVLNGFETALSPEVTRVASPVIGLGSGLLYGATGIAGPVITTYLHSMRLSRPVFILSLSILFQVYSISQAITLARLGLYTPARVFESFVALVPMMVIIPLASRMASRLSQRAFERMILVLLGATSLKLAWDGVTGLLG